MSRELPLDTSPGAMPAGDDARAAPFWQRKSLDEMNDAEWEALCDGCGRCCLQKLEDEDTGAVYYTDIACRLLDTERCHCRQYASRFSRVPDCLSVRPLTEEKLRWLPSSCAYRRLAEGRPLAAWHPLESGRADSVRRAGIGMQGHCVSEREVPVELWLHRIVPLDD